MLRLLQRAGRGLTRLVGRDSIAAALLRPVYAQVLTVLAGSRGIPWTINGVEYRIGPRHRPRMGPRYDAPVAEFLRARIRPGDVCLDVGANVGVYVLQFAEWTKPAGRVVAFEPNPWARAALEDHIRMNGLADRVTVMAAAAGHEAGEAVLFSAGTEGMGRLHAPNPAIADLTQPLSVPVVTLDEYCRTKNVEPDWLLIDVEGAELDVLVGAGDLIRTRGDRLGIIVELHPDVWEPEQSRERVAAVITDLGRKVVPLTGQADPLAEHGHVYLALKDERGTPA